MESERVVKNVRAKKATRAPRRDRVRSAVRRESPPIARRQEEQLKQLNVAAATAIGFSRAEAEVLPPPSVAFHFGLVGHGFEIHMFDEGRFVTSYARDFSGNYEVNEVKESLVDAIEKAVKAWKAKL